jgi:hypothetical protein
MDIVEVDDTIAGSARQCRHHDGTNPVSHRIPGEDQEGPFASFMHGTSSDVLAAFPTWLKLVRSVTAVFGSRWAAVRVWLSARMSTTR